jgi:rubrerythrin
MDIGSIFLVLALLLLVAWFVSRPLFERHTNAPQLILPAEEHERSALLAERDRILNALQELDFDNSLGKIPENEYPPQRLALMQQGADVLRQLDALLPEAASGEVEARLEAAIAARRLAASSPEPAETSALMPNGRKQIAATSPDDDLEIMLANRRRVRQEKAAGFCPQCGGPVQKSDMFCPKCGAKIALPA